MNSCPFLYLFRPELWISESLFLLSQYLLLRFVELFYSLKFDRTTSFFSKKNPRLEWSQKMKKMKRTRWKEHLKIKKKKEKEHKIYKILNSRTNHSRAHCCKTREERPGFKPIEPFRDIGLVGAVDVEAYQEHHWRWHCQNNWPAGSGEKTREEWWQYSSFFMSQNTPNHL